MSVPDRIERRLLSALRPNPLQPRGIDDDDAVEDLAKSIAATGLLQPFLITPDDVIVAGHRRRLACQMAGLTTVPVLVREMTETQQLEAMVAENVARRSLDPIELARACKALLERGRATAEIARHCGIGLATVYKQLQILELHPILQAKVAAYEMPLGYVPTLAEIKNPEQQLALGLRAMRENWLVSEMRQRRHRPPKPPKSPTERAKPPPFPVVTATYQPRLPSGAKMPPPEGRILDLLHEAGRLLLANRDLITDPAVRSALGRFARTIKEAQAREAQARR